MTEQQKAWIDNASYEELLHHWRNAPLGDAMLAGDCGRYFSAAMAVRKGDLPHGQQVNVSKRIGWS